MIVHAHFHVFYSHNWFAVQTVYHFVWWLVIILMTIFEVSEIYLFLFSLRYVMSKCDYVIAWKNVLTNLGPYIIVKFTSFICFLITEWPFLLYSRISFMIFFLLVALSFSFLLMENSNKLCHARIFGYLSQPNVKVTNLQQINSYFFSFYCFQ